MQGQFDQFYFMYKPAAEVIGVFLPSSLPHAAKVRILHRKQGLIPYSVSLDLGFAVKTNTDCRVLWSNNWPIFTRGGPCSECLS